jgi:DNA-binding NarL/FixJ family response regulator
VGVALIEPIGIVRASLRMLFDAERDIEVLGEAAEPEAALELAASLYGRSDAVALVGLELTGERDALWLIRSIRDAAPQLVVLATGTDLTGGAVSKALFVGADGFIHKNSQPERFIEATRRAAAGELVLEGLPRGALGEIVDGMEPRRKATSPLTEREQMVLRVAAEGLTAREIGRRLGVRERTVTTHLNHIYRKLGANGRVGALVAATRLGVLPASPPGAAGTTAQAAIAG